MLSTLVLFFSENLCTNRVLTKEQETLHVLREWRMIRSEPDWNRHNAFTEAVWDICFEHWINVVAYQKTGRKRFTENRKTPLQVGISVTSKVKRTNLIQSIAQSLDCDSKWCWELAKLDKYSCLTEVSSKVLHVSISWIRLLFQFVSKREVKSLGTELKFRWVKVVRERWKPFFLYLSSQ